MTKFMILFISPLSAEEQMQNGSPEEMKKVMELWMAWFAKCGSAIVEAGAPIGKGVNVTTTGSSQAQSGVAGYSIMQGENIEAVKAKLTDHPHLSMPGSSIEVLEILPQPM